MSKQPTNDQASQSKALPKQAESVGESKPVAPPVISGFSVTIVKPSPVLYDSAAFAVWVEVETGGGVPRHVYGIIDSMGTSEPSQSLSQMGTNKYGAWVSCIDNPFYVRVKAQWPCPASPEHEDIVKFAVSQQHTLP